MKTFKVNGSYFGVAFLEGNRNINSNNVKKMEVSLKEFGKNLMPMVYIKADDARLNGRKLKDAIDGTTVEEGNRANYIVVLDGQHRFTAAVKMEKEGFDTSKLLWEELKLDENKTIEEALIEINSVGQMWKGKDYISGLALRQPENEIVQFAKELTDFGVSAKTINKYFFLDEKFKWSKPDKDVLEKVDLARAKKIWDVVKQFPEKVHKDAIIIDYIIKAGGTKHWEDELKNVAKVGKDLDTKLRNLKVNEARQLLKNTLADLLDLDQTSLNGHKEGYHFGGSLLFVYRGMGLNFKHEAAETPRHRCLCDIQKRKIENSCKTAFDSSIQSFLSNSSFGIST